MYFITFCLFKERLGRLMGLVGYLSFVSYARATRGISVNLTFHFIFSVYVVTLDVSCINKRDASSYCCV